MAKGFLYVACNDAMPGLLKIGRTHRVPDERMSELFSTGVPEPFKIIYFAMTSDANADEAQVHKVLSRFRHSKNREFFAINSASAIGAIMYLCEIELYRNNSDIDTSAKESASVLQPRQVVTVTSRHHIESEETDLNEFIHELNAASLEALVVSAFYDSNSFLCSIELADGVDENSMAVQHIHAIALNTLSQFEMFGIVYHGRLSKQQ